MSLAIGLVLFGVLILVHELGHLWIAKALGVPAPCFSIGFGPVLAKWNWRDTEYRLSAVPLGGYVLIDALENGSVASPAKRIAIYAAGPAANILFAALVLLPLGRVEILPEMLLQTTAVAIGLFVGDIPVSELAGPVGIVGMAGKTAAMGVGPLAIFAAFLSANLAVLNLLPLPILDGGQIVIAAIEGLLRRPIDLRVRAAFSAVTWVLLLGLFFYVTASDVARLWGVSPA